MEDAFEAMGGFIIPAVAIVSVFTFIAVASWSDNRRKEREAYYRSETLRKAIEQGGESAAVVLQMMRDQEEAHARRRLDGLRLGGLITTAVGIGVMVFLYFVNPEPGAPVYLMGLIPLLIGLVLAIYGYTSSPKTRSGN